MDALARQIDADEPTTAELLASRPALRMNPLDGLLLEGVPLAAIAAAMGTPCWVMSAGTLRRRLARLQDAFSPLGAHVHYAVKANDHLAVLRIMAAGGAGADVVSGGELRRALLAGVPPGRIVFSGVGKTAAELREAAEAGIAQINVESAEERRRAGCGGLPLCPCRFAARSAAGWSGAAYRQPDRGDGALPRGIRQDCGPGAVVTGSGTRRYPAGLRRRAGHQLPA